MNRQIRREQAKQDKRVEKERQRKRAARRARIQSNRRRGAERKTERKPPAANGGSQKPSAGRGKRTPGRFSGVLMIATVFFIVLQAAVPAKQATTLNSVTGAGFFVLFGYFSVLYLERRGTGRALLMTLISGVLLVVGVTVARFLEPTLTIDWLQTGLAVPGIVAGAYLGRLVFFNSPA
ncbi:MAG: hypothetical protein P8Y13_00465 [Deinococcales bacterium]